MMNCGDARDLLPLWAGGDLSSAEAERLEAHLAACADCRAAAEAWRADLAALRENLAREAVPVLPPERLAAGTCAAALAMTRRRPVLRRPSFWAAAAPLAAVLALVVWWRSADVVPPVAGEGASWPELQQAFAGCLEQPVPLEEWETGRRAGVVTVLAPTAGGDRYLVADCIEVADLSRLRTYPWAEQRIAAWRARMGERLLVTVCATGEDDRAERRRLRRDVLTRFGPGG